MVRSEVVEVPNWTVAVAAAFATSWGRGLLLRYICLGRGVARWPESHNQTRMGRGSVGGAWGTYE